MVHGIHGGHVGQQCLSSANIGSGFFSFNMLFPCLQGHTQRPVSLCINTYTNDAAGDISFKIISA